MVVVGSVGEVMDSFACNRSCGFSTTSELDRNLDVLTRKSIDALEQPSPREYGDGERGQVLCDAQVEGQLRHT